MNKIINRILNYKSTIDGVSILSIVLSFWLAPDMAQELSATIATIWGMVKVLQKDN